MEKKSIIWELSKQLLGILWKLFLMMVLIACRVILMVLNIVNAKIEDFLKVPKKHL